MWVRLRIKFSSQKFMNCKESDGDDYICEEVAHENGDIWTKPPENWVKINWDGAYKNDTKSAGIGAIGRNSDGVFLDAVGKKSKGWFCNEC